MHDTMLRPLKDCINIIYDSKGMLYEIPNYCINDPFKFELDNETQKINKSNSLQEQFINVNYHYFFN